jgi:hypothetical protein
MKWKDQDQIEQHCQERRGGSIHALGWKYQDTFIILLSERTDTYIQTL